MMMPHFIWLIESLAFGSQCQPSDALPPESSLDASSRFTHRRRRGGEKINKLIQIPSNQNSLSIRITFRRRYSIKSYSDERNEIYQFSRILSASLRSESVLWKTLKQ